MSAATRLAWRPGQPWPPVDELPGYDQPAPRPQRALSPSQREALRQRREQRAEAESRRHAETFIGLAGTALEEAEAVARSYSEGWEELHRRAMALRDAADGLAELALELQ